MNPTPTPTTPDIAYGIDSKHPSWRVTAHKQLIGPAIHSRTEAECIANWIRMGGWVAVVEMAREIERLKT